VATLDITLPSDLIDFIEGEVAKGSYASVDELVYEALLSLQREQDFEAEKLAILRREIAVGLEDAAAGRLIQITASEIAEEVLREQAAD
jgi:antitoxin ParD1/3/4